MTALLRADPSLVRRTALVLEGTATGASAVRRQVDRQRPPCWRSPSSRDYVGQLTSLVQRVDRIVSSHDEAAVVLTAYARTLEEAQERARHAERLAAAGDRRSAAWTALKAVGPDPGWALSEAARRTVREAEELERAAASLAAARLRELAAAAPEQRWTSKALRPLEDAVVSAVDGWRGAPGAVAGLAGAAWAAVPWGHDAEQQRQGRATLGDAVRVWEGWLEAGRDVANGRPGLAVGVVGPGGFLRIKKGGDDGFLDGVAEGRLTVNDVDEAWAQAHAAKALQDRIVRLREVPLPGLDALLRGEVDLVHHEGRGGHTILRHVGKRLEVLEARLDLETRRRPTDFRSTFPDLATAEDLVRRTLLDDPQAVHRTQAGPEGKTMSLTLPLKEPVGTVMRGDGSITTGRSVKVVLKKEAGEVRVHTAYLQP